MFDIQLSTPLFLDSQLEGIAKSLNLSKSTLRQLAYHQSPCLGVVKEDTQNLKKGDIIPVDIVTQNENGESVITDNPDAEGIPLVTCTEAVCFLCALNKIEAKPLTEIYIPESVFSECNTEQWYDISSLFADVNDFNNRVKRMMAMNSPDIILRHHARLLWERVEMLETGHLGRSRRWSHGRTIRGLNDLGFSLVSGWSEGMKLTFEEEYDVDENEDIRRERKEERKRWERKQKFKFYLNRYMKQGLDFSEAFNRASISTNDNINMRPSTVEGIGLRFNDRITRDVLYAFLENHKRSFVRSEAEKEIYEQIRNYEDPYKVFKKCEYNLDYSKDYSGHWIIAVGNIIFRETGIEPEIFLAVGDDKYHNRNCIMFPQRNPWEYNDKEKRLTKDTLYKTLDRYALELKLTVCRECYYIFEVEDSVD